MNKHHIFTLLIGILLLSSCEKYLEEKPNIRLAIPSTAAEFQSLLDQYNVISDRDPSSGEVSAGDTYLTDADYLTRDDQEKRMYTWQNSSVYKEGSNDWLYVYVPVYTANSVIEAWQGLSASDRNQTDWKDVAGQAYLLRAKCFLNAVTLWGAAYNESTAEVMPGIALKLNANFNESSKRASIAESYNQVLSDLKLAAALLPVKPMHVVRASRPAAYGMLARTYLWMRRYPEASLYADSTLSIKGDLVNYNSLNASLNYSVPQFNAEVIMNNKMFALTSVSVTRAKVNLELYNQYESNDLRKSVFFRTVSGTYHFKGNYTAGVTPFSGIATDECYLIRAECRARAGDMAGALADLNRLLANRYRTGTFVPLSLTEPSHLLDRILKERRKELLYRGLRWPDIKRLNEEGANISLSRTVNGVTFTLPAKSRRFAMPLPEDVISLSAMEQNTY